MTIQKNFLVLRVRKTFEIKIKEPEMPVEQAWFSEKYGPFASQEAAQKAIFEHGDLFVSYIVVDSYIRFV